jgi:hypothetical protein
VETHGPLGTLWTGLGLGAFYIALTWINVLLGTLLTPLFIVPLTWLQDRLGIGVPKRREATSAPPPAPPRSA